MSATLDKIKEEVKTLAPDELHQVRELVDSLLTEPASRPQMTEDEFEHYLAAKGIISFFTPVSVFVRNDVFESFSKGHQELKWFLQSFFSEYEHCSQNLDFALVILTMNEQFIRSYKRHCLADVLS